MHDFNQWKFNENVHGLFGPDAAAATETLVSEVRVVRRMRRCERRHLHGGGSAQIEWLVLAATDRRQVDRHK